LTRKIRIGIVGARFGAGVHAKAFGRDRRAQIVAVAARSLKSAQEAARRGGIKAFYAGWQALLKSGGLDAVSIAVPPKLQPGIIREALRRGISVFAEKPLAFSLKDAEQVTALAQKSGLAHMVDYELTQIPAWMKAKELLTAGAIGKLGHISVSWCIETFANRNKKVSWKTQTAQGGGALSSFGCHALYALEWFAGPIREISAHLSKASYLPAKGDSYCVLSAKLSGDIRAYAEICTHAFPATGHEIRFFGEQGQILLINSGEDHVKGFKLFVADRKQPKFRSIRPRGDFNHRKEDGRIDAVAALAKKFLDWVVSGKPERPNFADALRVERLLDAARRSQVRKGAFVKVL
jgi:predicted dehydrogenase